MVLFFVAALTLVLIQTSCATVPAPPPTAYQEEVARCDKFASKYAFWGGLAAALSASGAAGVIATIKLEKEEHRWIVGLSAAGMIGLEAFAGFLAGDVLEVYSADCPPEVPEVGTSSVALSFD